MTLKCFQQNWRRNIKKIKSNFEVIITLLLSLPNFGGHDSSKSHSELSVSVWYIFVDATSNSSFIAEKTMFSKYFQLEKVETVAFQCEACFSSSFPLFRILLGSFDSSHQYGWLQCDIRPNFIILISKINEFENKVSFGKWPTHIWAYY